MSSFRLVFYALLAALIIGSMMMARSGNIPDWEQCRESLFEQMFSDQCTPRRGFAPENDGGSGAPSGPAKGRDV